MSETTYPPELHEKWVDPVLLAPAFAYLAMRPVHLLREQLNAWDLSQEPATRRRMVEVFQAL